MSQNDSTPLTKEEKKEQLLKIQAANDKVQKLVIKIISWRTGASTNSMEKITIEEWTKYERHLIDISKSQTTSVVKEKLAEIHAAIKSRDGFA